MNLPGTPHSHLCHAPGCGRKVKPRLFACRAHWNALSRAMQLAIWREYVPGQEERKDPTTRYKAVQRLACAQLATREGRPEAEVEELVRLAGYYRRMAITVGKGDPFAPLVAAGDRLAVAASAL